MSRLFEISLKDRCSPKTFVKVLESLNAHSDTGMFKVNMRGVYIKVTDPESFCASEVRIPTTSPISVTHLGSKTNFTAKIKLKSLSDHIKKMQKVVAYPRITARRNGELIVETVKHNTNEVIGSFVVDSLEYRPRIYYVISTNHFRKESDAFVEFSMPVEEWRRLITAQAIGSGTHGGVVTFRYDPVSETRARMEFIVESESGGRYNQVIHGSTKAAVAPILHLSEKSFDMKFLTIYAKRSLQYLQWQVSTVNLMISERGLIFSADISNVCTALTMIANVEGVDLESYA